MTPEPGLHKRVSSIFDGVRIPGQDTGTTGSESAGHRAPDPSSVGTPDSVMNGSVGPTADIGVGPGDDGRSTPMGTALESGAIHAASQADAGISAPAEAGEGIPPAGTPASGLSPAPAGTKPETTGPATPTPTAMAPGTSSAGSGSTPTSKDTGTGASGQTTGSPPSPKISPVPAPRRKPPSPWERLRARLTAGMDDPEVARDRKMKALVGVLGVVLAAVLFFVLREPKTSQARPADSSAATGATALEITWEPPAPIVPSERDPMRPATTSAGSSTQATVVEPVDTSRFVVTGIVQGSKGYFALISGQIVEEGETVFGARVVKIRPDGVELEMNGQQWTQPLRK